MAPVAGEIPFGWDNEFPGLVVDVPAFEIDVHNVTNEQFMDFVDAGGYRQPDWWTPAAFAWVRDDGIEHPRFWTRHDGIVAVARHVRGDRPAARMAGLRQSGGGGGVRTLEGRAPADRSRVPPGRLRRAVRRASGNIPWGDAPPDASRGLFDFASWSPVAAGRHPAGQSAWGVHDLMGNGWEWTSTMFAPFDGFRPMASYPEYSADFFDGQHLVMKGASPATDAALLRRSFRNWFRPNYPYVYATFRCVRSVE